MSAKPLGLDRRALMVGAAAAGVAGGARSQTPAPDPFGLRAILGPRGPNLDERTKLEDEQTDASIASLEKALAVLGQASILRAADKVEQPTFRLTRILHNWPSCARVEWEPVSMGAIAEVASHEGDPPKISPHSINYGAERGLRLRALLDDRERFWDAAPRPVNWDLRDDLLIISHVVYLLEARVGEKRHAILRKFMSEGSLVERAAKELLLDARSSG